jgi:hypothetical protein
MIPWARSANLLTYLCGLIALASPAGKDSALARGSKRMRRICASNPAPAVGRLGNPIDEQDFLFKAAPQRQEEAT